MLSTDYIPSFNLSNEIIIMNNDKILPLDQITFY